MNNIPDITWPRISVIVPMYNDARHIELLLESLLNQDYPKELLEIIVIDNNSTDTGKEIVEKFPVTLLEENEIQSSYAARNKGIRHAKGQVLVFIDSDCVAECKWLCRGVTRLLTEPADLVGGQVKFTFSEKQTAAEYYDSLTNFDFESKIKRGCAGAGNLFVKAEIFDSIGLFPDNVTSGGDMQWTARATEKGFLLVYEAETIVYHPARLFGELLGKLYRIGIGMGKILIVRNSSKSQIFQAVIGKLKPYSVSFIKQLIARKGCEKMNKKLLRIWLVANLFRPVMAMAIAQALFSKGQKMTRTDQ